MIGGNRIHIYPTVVLAAVLSTLFYAADVGAQSQFPVTGKYPGGHVGLRGGASPPPGIKHLAVFARFQDVYALKDDNGNTVQDNNEDLFADINVLVWNTHKKILGGTWGGLRRSHSMKPSRGRMISARKRAALALVISSSLPGLFIINGRNSTSSGVAASGRQRGISSPVAPITAGMGTGASWGPWEASGIPVETAGRGAFRLLRVSSLTASRRTRILMSGMTSRSTGGSAKCL